MVRYSATVIILILFSHKQISDAKIEYTIENAIDDLSFIPGARFILTTAVKLWLLRREVQELVQPNATRIEKELISLGHKLDKMAHKLDIVLSQVNVMAENVKDVKRIVNDKVVMEMPKEVNLNKKRDDFDSLKTKIYSLYQRFLKHIDKTKEHKNETLLKFADAIVDDHIDQLTSVLDQMKNLIVGSTNSFNMINLLANKHLSNTLICSRGESPLHQIYLLYRDAMDTELKSFTMTQFAYETKKNIMKLPISYYNEEINTVEEEYFIRISQIVKKMKAAMSIAHQDYWICDQSIAIEGDTYAKLGPIFQSYIIQENDIFTDGRARFLDPITGGCSGDCNGRQTGIDMCDSDYCKKHKRQCKGKIVNCKSFQEDLYVCHAEKTSYRRYKFLKALSGHDFGTIYGQNEECPVENQSTISADKLLLIIDAKNVVCEYCLCTCIHDDLDTKIHRYISLRNVISDVEKNKVVTGVRFTKEEEIFHIRIQQGVLMKNGTIAKNTTDWKIIDKFVIDDKANGQDYGTISWEKRTVNLDDLKTDGDNVLTGLRFKEVGDGFKLEIQITPFDFITGKLDTSNSEWISNPDDTQRTELSLENRDIPSTLSYQYLDSSDKQYFKFTTSSVKTDAGQTVVPFIDFVPVKTDFPVPLVGAGLIHKSNSEDSAGFLSFKLFTYNYAPHLEN